MDNFGRINLKRCSITQEFVMIEKIPSTDILHTIKDISKRTALILQNTSFLEVWKYLYHPMTLTRQQKLQKFGTKSSISKIHIVISKYIH
jgi:hypothetical protein